jgi:hypothetical protein
MTIFAGLAPFTGACHSQLGHFGSAFMHGLDDVELREAGMLNFAIHQRLRDDADDRAACVERGIRESTHQANPAAAVNQINAAPGEGSAHLSRGIGVEFVVTTFRTTEDTNAHSALPLIFRS